MLQGQSKYGTKFAHMSNDLQRARRDKRISLRLNPKEVRSMTKMAKIKVKLSKGKDLTLAEKRFAMEYKNPV